MERRWNGLCKGANVWVSKVYYLEGQDDAAGLDTVVGSLSLEK